jgi:hypothetical protein
MLNAADGVVNRRKRAKRATEFNDASRGSENEYYRCPRTAFACESNVVPLAEPAMQRGGARNAIVMPRARAAACVSPKEQPREDDLVAR